MIKYLLRCDADHEFEGWFGNSGDFDAQARDGRLSCPVCGSAIVGKGIMSPAVTTSDGRSRGAKIRRAVGEAARRARAYVEEHYDYVGERFPEEARKIHYGESDQRGIYGEASGAEVKALIAEGVEIAPLPGVSKREGEAGAAKPVDAPAKKTLN